jgi:hypothetical protein
MDGRSRSPQQGVGRLRPGSFSIRTRSVNVHATNVRTGATASGAREGVFVGAARARRGHSKFADFSTVRSPRRTQFRAEARCDARNQTKLDDVMSAGPRAAFICWTTEYHPIPDRLTTTVPIEYMRTKVRI